MKQIIIDYLNRKFQDRKYLKLHPGFFFFLRWIAEITKDVKKTDDVIYSIARYISNKHINLPFTDIFVVGSNVYVYTSRPGIWIGKMGSIYGEIVYTINHDINGNEISKFRLDFIEDLYSPQTKISKYINAINKY